MPTAWSTPSYFISRNRLNGIYTKNLISFFQNRLFPPPTPPDILEKVLDTNELCVMLLMMVYDVYATFFFAINSRESFVGYTYALWLNYFFFIHNFISFTDAFRISMKNRMRKKLLIFKNGAHHGERQKSGYHMNHKLRAYISRI